MAELADAMDLGSITNKACRFKSCYPHKAGRTFSKACRLSFIFFRLNIVSLIRNHYKINEVDYAA